MLKPNHYSLAPALLVAAALSSGCSSMISKSEAASTTGQDVVDKDQEIAALQSTVDDLKTELAGEQQKSASMPGTDLLPPNAKTGECYARVWVPASYRSLEKQMLVSEESERVEVIPAAYAWAEETVLSKGASSRLESIPAVYGTEKETIKIREATRLWRTNLGNNAPPASNELLATAGKHGINLDGATSGMCFHEHYLPAKYETVDQQVLVSEPTSKVIISPAQYRTSEKQVLVKEASSRLVNVPAVYGWEEETLVDKPAHTIWKKGAGPMQRIDESTGEIMCLVEVPATYKTIRKRVLKTPAATRTVEIPAEYKTVKVREMVSGPQDTMTEIPARYKTVKLTKKLADASFVWHEVHNREEPTSTRTGSKICLTEQPAQFKTVTRTVVKTPGTTRKVEIPADYKTVKVRKLVSMPQEKRIKIPAKYKTVQLKELDKEGFMEWRSILCKTNMTGRRISEIQQALKNAGYNPGPIDGDIGASTMTAVNAFQRDKGLPVDRYLNVKTLDALSVSPR